MNGTWIEHRRDDGELLGWLVPEEQGLVVVDLLGRRRSEPLPEDAARDRVESLGLAYLADRYEYLDDAQEWIRVRLLEVSATRVRLKREDYGSVDVPLEAFELPFPAGERLRSLDRLP